jgi:hypothetical protein
VSGYLRNRELVRILQDLNLSQDSGAVLNNLRHCYEALVDKGFFDRAELSLVDAWISDISKYSV